MKYIVFILGLTSFYVSSHAEIFQCRDQSGKTIYKDSECQNDEVMEDKIDIISLRKKTNIATPQIDTSSPLGKNLLKN